MSTSDDSKTCRINVLFTISIKNPFWITNVSFPFSIEIDNNDNFTPQNAEPSMN
jgi:hypothetical protein